MTEPIDGKAIVEAGNMTECPTCGAFEKHCTKHPVGTIALVICNSCDDERHSDDECQYESLRAQLAALQAKVGDAEGREASLCDLLNTWARETGGIEQAQRPEDAKLVADRLWGALSHQIAALYAEIDAARGRVTTLEGHLAFLGATLTDDGGLRLNMRRGDHP